MDQEEPDKTDSVQTRYPYTNDILAAWTLFTFPIVVALIGLNVMEFNQGILLAVYVTVVAISATWTFGSDAVEILHNMR